MAFGLNLDGSVSEMFRSLNQSDDHGQQGEGIGSGSNQNK